MNDTPGIHPVDQCSCPKDDEVIILTHMPLTDSGEMPGEAPVELPVWLAQYLDDVRKELAEGARICGAVALNEKHLGTAIRAASGCAACSEDVTKFLWFARRLERSIDDRIASASNGCTCVIYLSSNSFARWSS